MFIDRREAGEKLAEKVAAELEQTDFTDTLILSIPRGGIVVGKEIADKLNLVLEVLVVKKIPAPGNPELAIGAVGGNGIVWWNEQLLKELCVTEIYRKEILAEKGKELADKENFFRTGKLPLNLKDKKLIMVDDGAATGATILSAIKVAREQKPKEIMVALPVVALDTLKKIEAEADKVVYLEAPEMFFALAEFYQNFSQVTDSQVKSIIGG